MAAVGALVGHCCTALLNSIDAPLKLRPDDAVQICLLLLLLFTPTSTKPQAGKLLLLLLDAHTVVLLGK